MKFVQTGQKFPQPINGRAIFSLPKFAFTTYNSMLNVKTFPNAQPKNPCWRMATPLEGVRPMNSQSSGKYFSKSVGLLTCFALIANANENFSPWPRYNIRIALPLKRDMNTHQTASLTFNVTEIVTNNRQSLLPEYAQLYGLRTECICTECMKNNTGYVKG